MLVKLNKSNKGCSRYDAPFEVTRHFDDPDPSASVAEQSEHLFWVSALLVSRFLHQFPFLKNEADELFSIGCMTICEVVSSQRYENDKVGAVCNVKACRAMEDYINGLNSVVKVCTTTRYSNLKKGVESPVHRPLTAGLGVVDDHSEILVRDAAECLGYDIKTLTLHQKRKLREKLL